METNKYANQNKETVDTDLELKLSPSSFDNIACENYYNDIEENDQEFKHTPDVHENELDEKYPHGNHDDAKDAIIVQNEALEELECEKKPDKTLLIFEHEPVCEIESKQPNVAASSKKRKKQYPCQYCQKSFTSRCDRQSHENIHNGIKPFTCDICGKSFRQKNVLRTHQTVHFGKSIKCEECGRKFACNSQLNIHYRMHRDEKRYFCDYDGCDAAFRERRDLIRHQKIHAGTPEHKCQYCKRTAFYHRKGLLAHVRAIHRNIRYQCDLCERAYNRPYKIRNHLQAAHNIQQGDVSKFKQKIINTEDDIVEVIGDGPNQFIINYLDDDKNE